MKISRNTAGLVTDIAQGSPEWLALRRGKITGTSAHAIMIGGSGADEVINNLVIERVSNSQSSGYKSRAMLRGHEMEEEARAMFEIAQMDVRTVHEVGAVHHGKIENFMISPDGLFEEFGVLEIKSFEAKNYFEHLRSYKDNPKGFRFLEDEYNTQVQAGLACTGNDYGIGVIYNPDFVGHEYIEFLIERNDKFISILEEKVEEALYKCELKIKRYFE